MRAGGGEGAPQLVARANQRNVDRIARQAVARRRIAWHMAAGEDAQAEADRPRQDHIGGERVGDRQRERQRQAPVGGVENNKSDDPDGQPAEAENKQALEEQPQRSHRVASLADSPNRTAHCRRAESGAQEEPRGGVAMPPVPHPWSDRRERLEG